MKKQKNEIFILVLFMMSFASFVFGSDEGGFIKLFKKDYEDRYEKILLKNNVVPKGDLIPKMYRTNFKVKSFYISGYIRGLLDCASYEKYRNGKGLGLHQNLNGGLKSVEYAGWLDGFKRGHELGKMVEKEVIKKFERIDNIQP